ncbi:hypothetical protein FA15DRAFT_586440 [Coprinopsis marcescibilis]|uniref:F-box domain-containing protein n=1 Tax=Coprinopsis marcescibilis TaxID=230819 RepID=A0A5C3L3M6_COPMA|nr:hypothetical protein FA15DRAFT_586440 [Coprinopsis marcescibilis]
MSAPAVKRPQRSVKPNVEESSDSKPPGEARNPRTGQNQRQNKKGKLWMMAEMPIDVLHEIFGHLEPRDLLYLARTTKGLRNILMQRTSRGIWVRSFAALEGYPRCPKDMQEPQYANLMFSNHCHVRVAL